MRMYGDIFAAARLWRGRLLTTGRLSCLCVRGVSGELLWRVGRWRGRAPGAALPSACGLHHQGTTCVAERGVASIGVRSSSGNLCVEEYV